MINRNSRQNSTAYKCLADLNDAGLPLLTTLENLRDTTRAGEGTNIPHLIRHVRKGEFLHQAMNDAGLPPLDVALIKVGEKTGNLTATARFLSEYYEERYKIEQSLKSAALKPALMFLLSVFTRDLPRFVADDISLVGYLFKSFATVAFVGAVAFIIWKVYRVSQRTRITASAWASALRRIPWVGRWVEAADLERFFTCLSLGLTAGCDFKTMLEIAAEMTVLPEVHRAALNSARDIQKLGLAQAFRRTGVFNQEQLMVIQTGEVSGKLEDSFKKLCTDLRAEVKKYIVTFEDWMPKIVYGIAMIYAITGIFGTLSTINRIRDVKV